MALGWGEWLILLFVFVGKDVVVLVLLVVLLGRTSRIEGILLSRPKS